MKNRVAYFITAHGFGHAARASAIMSALSKNDPELQFDIYTRVPEWFFQDSLQVGFDYHPVTTDVGLVQNNPMESDLPHTLRRLRQFFPIDLHMQAGLLQEITRNGCNLVISDISPLGIEIAGNLGLPSILIENFTWDWIYQAYIDQFPEFQGYSAYLNKIYSTATAHIQTKPWCEYWSNTYHVNSPISRNPRVSRIDTREKLDIPLQGKMILITMGGVEPDYSFLKELTILDDVYLVIPGASQSKKRDSNIILLPHHSDFYHPDLLAASDGVIGKLGYSTLAETYRSGIPIGYVLRKDFPESATLAKYVDMEMQGFEISENDFRSGEWTKYISPLLDLPHEIPNILNGADRTAEIILGYL